VPTGDAGQVGQPAEIGEEQAAGTAELWVVQVVPDEEDAGRDLQEGGEDREQQRPTPGDLAQNAPSVRPARPHDEPEQGDLADRQQDDRGTDEGRLCLGRGRRRRGARLPGPAGRDDHHGETKDEEHKSRQAAGRKGLEASAALIVHPASPSITPASCASAAETPFDSPT